MPGDQQAVQNRSNEAAESANDRDDDLRFRAALRLARALYPANAGILHIVDFPTPAR